MLDNTFQGGFMVSNSERSDVKKASFWVSQLVIIIATVGGVYLAASQGLKQAIQFDSIRSEQNNYYLRKSLQNELGDNVGYIRDYINKVNQRVANPTLDLETFVWNSMTYSSTALETPSDLLRDAQRFYHQVDEIMKGAAAVPVKNKALEDLAKRIESEVLPKFEADTKRIKDRLAAKNIDV